MTMHETGMTWKVLQVMHWYDQDWTGITRYETGIWQTGITRYGTGDYKAMTRYGTGTSSMGLI